MVLHKHSWIQFIALLSLHSCYKFCTHLCLRKILSQNCLHGEIRHTWAIITHISLFFLSFQIKLFVCHSIRSILWEMLILCNNNFNLFLNFFFNCGWYDGASLVNISLYICISIEIDKMLSKSNNLVIQDILFELAWST